MITRPITKFSLEDAQSAMDKWGMNCGPGAIAAILDITLDNLYPYMNEFIQKKYTNPRLMWSILNALKKDGYLKNWWNAIRGISKSKYSLVCNNGLVRVQWEGEWTDEGKGWATRQRHTHWIASKTIRERGNSETFIFDINCMCVGGWVSISEWIYKVAPWLIKEVEPEGYGTYHFTHKIEISLRE